MSFNVSGSFPASLVPAQARMALNTNFLSFDDATGGNFAQQYLPELYEAEIERYGNRTIGGFLRMVGAEMPMTSDQVIWSEQNRLHIAYQQASVTVPGGLTDADIQVVLNLAQAQPGLAAGSRTGAVRVGQTILMTDNATGLVVQKGLVQAVTGATSDTLEVKLYGTATNAMPVGANLINLYVYGSEFGKGAIGLQGSIEPSFTQFSNRPIILKDNFQISGSDTAQIGWVEVATEDGQSGYLWYLKSESETRLRFEDTLEMAMVEAENMNNAAYAALSQFQYGGTNDAALTTDIQGSEGLFAAIEARGNVYSGFAGAAAPGSGALGDFDEILKNLDKQGAIEENMLFLSRSTALDFDDMIAAVNGGFASTTAASYGLFENDGDMALNFGFSGFRRGSYDFYKTDWKYLNDASLRGLSKEIDGVMIPAGTTTVYDQMLGSNIRRPFLHVRYRASETEDRRMKSWVTGSVGGAYTDTLDAMTVSFLSERCLVTQAANNFVLFKGA
eukprot:COSAG01_NODE_2239_length_8087_cov_20.702303_3_plen_503_part_00